MTQLLVVWVGVMAGLLVTPLGRATLARWLADMRRVLGFRRPYDRRHMGRRWAELAELAAAEDAADPRLRRCAAVKDAYLAGEFGPDELDWRILLALQPPPPSPRSLERQGYVVGSRVVLDEGPISTDSTKPSTGEWRSPRANCRFHELHSGTGYVGTVCDCGHDMNQHYDGGCNHCAAFWRMMKATEARAMVREWPVGRDPQFPRPEMQEIGLPPAERDPSLYGDYG